MKKEPRRVPDWVTWIGCTLMVAGILVNFRPLVVAAAALSTWWLVQHIRWANWDVARRVEGMKAVSDESE